MTRNESRKLRVLCIAAALVAASICSTRALATGIIFTINSGQSTIAWSGAMQNEYSFLGPFVAQSPGSLSTAVSGHFLVEFDPTTSSPTTLQFIGGHGYYEAATPYMGLPGVSSPGVAEPANMAGKTAGGDVIWSIRDLVWDFTSSAIAGSSGSFPANQTSFIVLGGGMQSNAGSDDWTGSTDFMTGGTWLLSESSPGSGDWTLSGGSYFYYDVGIANFTATSNVVSTAHYSNDNSTPVPAGPTEVDVLGGASTTGGVSATFDEASSGGTLSVQQVPNQTALTPAAIAAGEANPVFALSTDTLAANPQIWNVDFTGDLNGGSVTLVFNYDPTLLPPGLDENLLGIWHFSSATSEWDFGGTVDVPSHTITYVTDSFSPFQLGVAVPEPSSTALALFAAVGLAGVGLRRHRARRS
jgi:hypothetical protein